MESSSGGMFDPGISFSSMKQPPLIKQLKGILSEYPDGGQILKELIQNAEDAEATEVRILYDGRCINDQASGTTQTHNKVSKEQDTDAIEARVLYDRCSSNDQASSTTRTYDKFFKGPALCVFNDAIFTESDWEGIRMIYSSVKEEDPLKVGRFGLGFKSVFHITDYPCVISGDKLLMIDPQQPADRVNAMVHLSRVGTLENVGLSAEAFWTAFDGTFGLNEDSVKNGYFQGTIFRFPLRQKTSELSETLYDDSKVMDLFEGFKSEASCLLLFLKHLETIAVCTRGNTAEISEILKVEIKDDTGTVKQNRCNFKKKVKATDSDYNGEDIKNEMNISILTTTHGQSQRHEWIVVNYFVGKSATAKFRNLIHEKSLGYSPYVGVAAPLLISKDVFEGHVFCFLPLPREGSRLTGLPVHVNGFFALSQNRHHLKLETDEQKSKKIDDKSILWNKCLINEALPKAYQVLIHALITRSVLNGNTSDSVALVYSCLPISSNVQNRWSDLEFELYSRLATTQFFYSKYKNKWISLPDSCFATFSNVQPDHFHVQNAVKSCLNEIGKYYVDIPTDLFHTFKRHNSQIQDLTPQLLTSYLHQSSAYRNMSHGCKLDILTYILSDKTYQNANGLELLPVYNERWTSFKKLGETIYSCSEDILEILPGQEHRLLLNASSLGEPLTYHLKQLCSYGLSQIREMTTSALLCLLEDTIKCHLGTSTRLQLTRSTHLSVPWLQHVWHYITAHGDISSFTELPIVPVIKSGTWESPLIIDLARLSDLLLVRSRIRDYFPDGVCRCFEALGVTILEGLPVWIPENLIASYCFWPTSKSAAALLSRISSADNAKHSVAAFNQRCSWNDKIAMRTLLEKSQFELTEEAWRLIREMKIFRAINYMNEGGYDASVHQIPRIINDTENFPRTIELPFTCIRVESSSSEVFVANLGAKKISMDEIITETLKRLESGRTQTKDEMETFIEYFIRSFHLFKNNTTVVHHARNLHFLRTGPNSHKFKAAELFDPSDDLLIDLFHEESLLPESNKWNSQEDLLFLRFLGLKEINDVDSNDIFQVAKTLEKWSREGKQENTVRRKAAALMQILYCRSSLLGDLCRNGIRLADCIKYLSCIPAQNKVSSYPACLGWYSHNTLLCKPSEAKDVSLCGIIGATMPTVACTSELVTDVFHWKDPPQLSHVLKQLKITRDCFSAFNRSELMPVIKSIYEHLSEREDEILPQKTDQVIWTGEEFVSADKIIVYKEAEYLDLRPYLFSLPEEYNHIHTLFIKLGCPRQQDIHILQKTLDDISIAHGELQSEQTVRRDRRIVCDILDRIAGTIQKGLLSLEEIDILIMVQDSEPNKLRLRPVAECTYDDDPACFYKDDGVYLVHEMITIEIAETLGVKSITRKAALDAEEIGVEEWGQQEHLTTRLHALLRDGYTDGLSVPKELIQNADDAGASTVKFLYDERQNLQIRERLLSKGMKGFQGPALWVYNDAKFSNEDLRNITQLNAATKKRDVKKIGKFGLGFCSVYNLTDMPSFVTGSSLVIFDPHEKHLGSVLRSRGTGLKYQLPNKNLVARHIDQFKPYEDVFGCNIIDDTFSEYNGTLFRLPLRTEHQAKESKIYRVSYTHEEMIKLLRMFIKAAGNMLIFSQSVKSVEIYHLKEKALQASEVELLFKMHKNTLRWENSVFKPVTESVLSRIPNCLQRKKGLLEIHKTVISQIMKSNCRNLLDFVDDISDTDETVWLISWATGERNSLTLSKSMASEGAVPLSAIAVPCASAMAGTPVPLRNVRNGFYQDGHIFCFLPLPLTTDLQMHINGCFAVTFDRRQLVSVTEDDKGNRRSTWNSALLEDATVVAFVHLLETLKEKTMNVDPAYMYYKLWPSHCAKNVLPFKNAFYRHVLITEAKVFYGCQSWKAFKDVVILDPNICKQKFGKLAFEALSHIAPRHGKTLIEMPNYILENIKQSNLDKTDLIHSTIISEKDFFLIFLRHIQDKFWENRLEERNVLIAAAINFSDTEVCKEIQSIKCIPTEPLHNLNKPNDLIHPNSHVSLLFNEEDERFPINTQDFRSYDILKKLVGLGMHDKSLPISLLKDRCESISDIAETCCTCARTRCVNVIEFICKSDVLTQLETEVETARMFADLYMFPVLSKPTSWKFTWCAEKTENSLLSFDKSKHCQKHSPSGEDLLLGQSKNLFRETLRDYVGSIRCIFDESVFNSVKTRQNDLQRLLNNWGVKRIGKLPLHLLIEQMIILSCEYVDKTVQYEELRRVHSKIFIQFERIATQGTESQNSLENLNQLRGIPVVLIGNDLVKTEHVAFCLKEVYKPLLYNLPDDDRLQFKVIYTYLGVKEYFDVQYILRSMASLKEGWQSDENSVKRMTVLLVNLKDSMERSNTEYGDLHDFYDLISAPDTNCHLWPTYELATENLDFASNVAIKILHKDIPPSVGTALGVKAKQLKCFQNISVGISFGQREKLVSRIKGLLKAYPCDASIMKELLQNADDAGATEIHFVKDYRNHAKERLISKSCEPLQGPSLCVYNNSYFTKEDLEGLHDLGEGSKSDDPNKTGQYGVGFNAVYHLTDTPAFISKGPNESDSYLLILDPLCKHVPEATVAEPGQLCKLIDIQSNFPDHLLGFSQGKLITGEVGTVFRFPLREEPSEIGREKMDINKMDFVLNIFKNEMHEAVLFLKNIKCIKVSNITTGELEEEFSITVQLSKTAAENRKQFSQRINKITSENKNEKEKNLETIPHEVLYPLTVVDSNDSTMEWLIVQRFGSTDVTPKTDELKNRIKGKDLGLLPIGGVAIPLKGNLLSSKDEKRHDRKESSQPPTSSSIFGNIVKLVSTSYQRYIDKRQANHNFGKLFCFLPLPVCTGLPVHVNGHFALDHVSRRELWKEGYRMDWNNFILESVIVPSWINGLLYMRDSVQTDIETANTWHKVNELLQKCHDFFPLHSLAESKLWENVITLFYCKIITHKAALFPYVQDKRSDICKKTETKHSRFCLRWTHLNSASNTDLCGVFNTVIDVLSLYTDKIKTSHLIGHLLKSFGMKLVETPKTVFKEFIKAGIKDVPSSSPDLVISFLKSSSCDIGSVNVEISGSRFITANNLYDFVKYISRDKDFAEKIENLPVLLTADGTLRIFSEENAVFISQFYELLPKSSCKFVHCVIRSLFTDEKLFKSRVCKKFNFEEFLTLLPNSVERSVFAVGSKIQWNEKENDLPGLVSEEWLCLLFDFLCYESQTRDKSQVMQLHHVQDSRLKVDTQRLRSNIDQLHEWSFLPCINKDTGSHYLIPFCEASYLLYLPIVQQIDSLGKALNKLCLPTIDMHTISKCKAKELVKESMIKFIPSIDSPSDVLDCLVYHKCKIRECNALTKDEAAEIIAYFGRNVSILLNNSDKNVVARKIRELPLFLTLQGTLTSIDNNYDVLVIPRGMPYHGIQEWADCCSIILLEEKDSFDVLYEVQGLKKADIEFVYGEKILPQINQMPSQYWMEHIIFLRDRLGNLMANKHAKERIKEELKTIAFVNASGTMKRVNELFDPDDAVFRCMKDESDFPPTNFRKVEWRYFLEELGLICDVSDEMIIAFANQIELEGNCSQLSDAAYRKSEIILNRFLRDHGTKWRPTTLAGIKTVRFIKPYEIDKQRIKIWPQYGSANRLICFQDSTSSSYTSLCWTSIDLLPERTYQKLKKDVRDMLGIYDSPPIDKVILHCQNVCDALRPQIKCSGINKQFVEDQMTCFYEYFTGHMRSNQSIIQARLRYTPFIHLPDENDLVLAKEVIIDLHSDSQIKPYLYQAPKYYGKYHNLFELIGSKQKLMLCHYADILQKIKDKCKDSEMMHFEKGVAQKAVQGLLRLKPNSGCSADEIASIYLPNENLVLLKSALLTVSDNYWFERRLRDHVPIDYFAGLSFIEFTEIDIGLLEVFSKWPPHLKPVLLSEVVDEIVCLENEKRGMQTHKAMMIEHFFHSQEFAASVGGILQQQFSRNGKVCEETLISEIMSTLNGIRVYELTLLRTVLKYQGNIISGTEKSIPYHIDRQEEFEQIIFYFTDVNETNDVDISQILDGLISLIQFCVPVIDCVSTRYVTALLQCIDTPERLTEVLERFQITPFLSRQASQRDYFPKPGTYVESKFIPFLEQGIEPFRDYEYDHVAMELEDTDFDIDDVENADPVYIYVKILQENSNSNLSGDLGKMYMVRTGNPDVFSEPVSIFRLYRFVRPEEDPGTDVQRYDAEPINSKPFDEQCRRIRKDLQERAYYDNYEEYSRCERTGNYSHYSAQKNTIPDANEARRWMRQAKSDLQAAAAMLPVASGVNGYNWICYMCHQACEKALKAAKYSRDANNVPRGSKSHNLSSLTSETAILKQVSDLESKLGDHARLRYPDAASRPRIPSDIFSREYAEFAIDVARNIIDHVDDDIS